MYNIRNMKRVNYYLAIRQIEKLKEISKEEGISVSEILRRIIDKYLQQYKNK